MSVQCPNCVVEEDFLSGDRKIVRFGSFHRRSDSRTIQRFRCLHCKRTFSHATFNFHFREKKRNKNDRLKKYLCSGISERRIAKLLYLNRKTVALKIVKFGLQAERNSHAKNLEHSKATVIEFDDLETIEHTKCKPVSVTLAVESESRRILGLEVSRMPAKGRLAKISLKKYGFRVDERSLGRERLFKKIKPLLHRGALIKSDSNPHYPNDVKRHFPDSEHQAFLGQRGSVTGQGELKKIRFDPLFSLNHTCAMFRANINLLFRKTWCTSKKPERLIHRLYLYAEFHNSVLIGH